MLRVCVSRLLIRQSLLQGGGAKREHLGGRLAFIARIRLANSWDASPARLNLGHMRHQQQHQQLQRCAWMRKGAFTKGGGRKCWDDDSLRSFASPGSVDINLWSRFYTGATRMRGIELVKEEVATALTPAGQPSARTMKSSRRHGRRPTGLGANANARHCLLQLNADGWRRGSAERQRFLSSQPPSPSPVSSSSGRPPNSSTPQITCLLYAMPCRVHELPVS